jgi:hypothetical protein
MKRSILGGLFSALLLIGSLTHGADSESPHLSADYAKRRDQVQPGPREKSYRTIAWRTSVLRGVIDAQKKDRPVMLVLMNGHPLGCT